MPQCSTGQDVSPDAATFCLECGGPVQTAGPSRRQATAEPGTLWVDHETGDLKTAEWPESDAACAAEPARV